ncbi:hypothetical protein HHS_00680 [Candidatus Pantoea carbekii]|uniref:Uncharacterized protein n=1 Tax=Candidatus Pantoea carbekii TaxID=1235990 RepID=U3U8S7_9GAMM|nr:hypothetical protein HHS_00680 [Candidatus Pantoea carbekii]
MIFYWNMCSLNQICYSLQLFVWEGDKFDYRFKLVRQPNITNMFTLVYVLKFHSKIFYFSFTAANHYN